MVATAFFYMNCTRVTTKKYKTLDKSIKILYLLSIKLHIILQIFAPWGIFMENDGAKITLFFYLYKEKHGNYDAKGECLSLASENTGAVPLSVYEYVQKGVKS